MWFFKYMFKFTTEFQTKSINDNYHDCVNGIVKIMQYGSALCGQYRCNDTE